MKVLTKGDPADIRCRLRFLIQQYDWDVSHSCKGVAARAQALRDAGVSIEGLQTLEQENEELLRCGNWNRNVVAGLFSVADFVQSTSDAPSDSGRGSAFYDSVGQVIRGLARDWSDVCTAVRAQSLESVLELLGKYVDAGKKTTRVLVPGCGLGRLAFEASSRMGCEVVASDESAAMVAALTGLVKQGHVTFYPALDAAAPGVGGVADRFRQVDAVVPDHLKAARVTVEHSDFTANGGPEAHFDAVATLFVIDAVTSLPAAVAAVARLLRPGGYWVNYGPLRKHRESRHFTFEDVIALTKASGLSILEDSRFSDVDYLPRDVTLGMREIYDVQLLVAQKNWS